MKYTWLENYLSAKKGVEKDYKSEWGWDRYLLGGKMFAAVCYDDNGKAVYITLKLEPAEGEFMRQQYADIIPGYYMNKVHWNSIKADGDINDELLKNMLDKSYNLILNSLSKKAQQQIINS